MTVDPSSLIFVVIVAIWAAYLLGHWIRRRDQVATARSVDRFSEAMRVLERRPAVRSVPLSRPNPRSYVVAPTQRPAPSVTVKRAAAVTRPEPRPEPRRPQSGPRTSRRARQVRGLSLLGLLVATPVVWLLAAATAAVPWWAGVLVTLALLGVVSELRRSARRARRARAVARRRDTTERRTVARARRETRREVVGQLVTSRRGAGQTELATTAGHTATRPDDAGGSSTTEAGWQPVPVPPPTYTLKPKAPAVRRRVVPTDPDVESSTRPAAPAAPAAAEPATTHPAVAHATPAPAFDLDEILERRIAAGG